MDRLEAVDAKALGMVLNKVPARRAATGAYTYSYEHDQDRRRARRAEKGAERGRRGGTTASTSHRADDAPAALRRGSTAR
jgi:hypothetical protein